MMTQEKKWGMYTSVWPNFLNRVLRRSNMMIVSRIGGKKVNTSLAMLMVSVLRSSLNISGSLSTYL